VPLSISFTDFNPNNGLISGLVQVQRPANDSQITEYVAYAASSNVGGRFQLLGSALNLDPTSSANLTIAVLE
jgi:hypothetical protein